MNKRCISTILWRTVTGFVIMLLQGLILLLPFFTAANAPKRKAAEKPLVDREPERELVTERLDIVRHGGKVFQNIINFVGVIGIGKTILLRSLLYEKLEGVPKAFIDFADKRYRGSDARANILSDIAAGIKAETEVPFLSAKDSGALVAYVERVLGERDTPIALFFDALEEANDELVTWLESEVIGPLAETERVVTVLAGRKPVRWRRFDVRNRVIFHRLQPFTDEETGKQLPTYSYVAENLIKLTFGHPLANEKMAEEIQKLGREKERRVDQSFFVEYGTELIQLLQNIVDRFILKGLDKDIDFAIRTISPLRQFDVNTLNHMLRRFDTAQKYFTSDSGAYYLSVVGKMVRTTLVEWDSARRGYALDNTLRRMLSLIMLLEEPRRFMEINEEVAELYGQWVATDFENRSGFIIERLYHLAQMLKANGKNSEIQATLMDELGNYLAQYYRRDGEVDVNSTNLLLQQLSGDTELEETIPGVFPLLKEAICKFIGNAEGI